MEAVSVKIKYVWFDQPEVEKVFDTVYTFDRMPSIFRQRQTQEGYDAFQLENFAKKKEEGLVLSYKVIEEEAE